ncbi:hypothetical protein GGI07_005747 [Coemansia sp. Benny D115]|nr:hypothetical protein GGI07_005747 [Coemansia sp. Benny D115]
MHTRSDITALFSIGAVLLLCTPGPGDYAEAAIDPADASEKKRLRRRGWYPSYGDYYYAAPYAGGYYGVPYAGGYYGAPYGGVLDLQLGLGLHI